MGAIADCCAPQSRKNIEDKPCQIENYNSRGVDVYEDFQQGNIPSV
jgi:hypothetical protein